jgi:hypothetical protein
VLNKLSYTTTAAEPVGGESQPASMSAPRDGRVYSKLDCNIPVPSTVTADPLSLLPSPPSSLYSFLYLRPSLHSPYLLSLLLFSLLPCLRPSPPSTLPTSCPLYLLPSFYSPFLLFHLSPLRPVLMLECGRPITVMPGLYSVLLLL